MSDDVLVKYADIIKDAERPGDHPAYQWCIAYLAAEVRALREERDEIKRKAIEQSEYIQSHGLTEYEMARLKARVAELEGILKRRDDAEIAYHAQTGQ